MPEAGFVRHLGLIYLQPQKRLVFEGGLGPLQDQPVNGNLIWTLSTIDKGTEVTLEYRVFVRIVGGMAKWPAAVDFVFADPVWQFAAFAAWQDRR
jgi:hypothetical protein